VSNLTTKAKDISLSFLIGFAVLAIATNSSNELYNPIVVTYGENYE